MAGSGGPAFDYIIAGGGSAGCALAARLCENPKVTVLLIEAGGPGDGLLTSMPAALGMVQSNPDYDWAYETIAQPSLGGRRISYPRGKGLGGSSLINGMIYMRGNPGDFDRWAEAGLAGWGYAEVLPYFLRSARAAHRPDSPFHGDDGTICVTPAGNFNRLDERFIAAARQAGAPAREDFNGPCQLGVGCLDLTVRAGSRHSAAKAYLAKRPKNLSVETGARVSRILIEGQRALGVETSKGRFLARAEVIVSLGAFETPKLLLLSGIGPGEDLGALGIEVVRDLPGVGCSLLDHPNLPLQFELLDPGASFAKYQKPGWAAWIGACWLLSRSGPAAAPFWSTALFHAFDEGARPDLEVFFTSMCLRDEADGDRREDRGALASRVARGKVAVPGVQFDINLQRPRSRGRVTLESPDPMTPPRIDCGYLTDERDGQDLVRGIRHMRRVAEQPALCEAVGPEIAPGAAAASDGDLLDFVRERVITGHHPACTARMGPEGDPTAVLDARFRLRGLEGLRVVDASALPGMICGNIHASVIMMAERAADMILNKPLLAPFDPRAAAASKIPTTLEAN